MLNSDDDHLAFGYDGETLMPEREVNAGYAVAARPLRQCVDNRADSTEIRSSERTAATEFDAVDQNFQVDPYPVYAQLREHTPIFYNEETRSRVVTRYHDIVECLKRSDLISHDQFWDEPVSRHDRSDRRQAYVVNAFSHMMMYKDGQPHARMRKQSNRTFTPPQVKARQPEIERICRTLLEECRERGRFDDAHDFAQPLPSIVIADYLGLPQQDRQWIRALADRFAVVFEPLLSDPERTEILTSTVPLVDYLFELIDTRRRQPGDDFVSLLVAIRQEDGGMTDVELCANLMHLLVAGNETTTNLLEHMIVQLTRFPEMRADIESDPEKIRAFMEETLRYEAPIQIIARKTTDEVTLYDQQILPGSLVAFVLGSGNRDEARFPDPDTFDPTRADKAHLSFASGAHFCLGAPLARLQGNLSV
ncbi:cytochrome P450 [Mycobacterium persicum]|uniref:cytochrome P450 n=1 Tax=Mycobacterium persicum TaxID=1487726 RepID=UPI000A0D9AA2|nr:cytochrome P450 [Mycobacterium persicum]ORC04408.1 hypothetical protein B1T48_27355 [Mycobacterium persicum]